MCVRDSCIHSLESRLALAECALTLDRLEATASSPSRYSLDTQWYQLRHAVWRNECDVTVVGKAAA